MDLLSSLPLHPLNTHFRWVDRPLVSSRRLTPDQIGQYNREGYCVVDERLSSETLQALLIQIDPLEARITNYTIRLDGHDDIAYAASNMTFTTGLVEKVPAVRALCQSDLMRGITQDLIGGIVRLYWDQAVYKKPEQGRNFPWHQDNGYTFVEPQIYLTCWIALTEATLDNGCPWILPGFHKRGTLRHVMGDNGIEIEGLSGKDDVAIATPLPAGGMVLFSSLTPHRTAPNTSRSLRKALILQFTPDGTTLITAKGERIPQTDPARNMLI